MDFNSLRKEIISNNASVKELVNNIFTKIDHKDPEINSFICTTKDYAIAQAEKIDKLILNKEKSSKVTTDDSEKKNYKAMKVAELKAELKEKGLSTSGKKAELIKRLEN